MELPTKTRFSQIIIERPESNLSIVKSFISSPPISLEKKVGKIFGLIDVKSNQPSAEALIDFIINQTQTKYYQQVTDDVTPKIDLETFFESALQKINIAIATFLETESVKIDLKKIGDENLKKFLVDHKLGIECSGLVYHILNALLHEVLFFYTGFR